MPECNVCHREKSDDEFKRCQYCRFMGRKGTENYQNRIKKIIYEHYSDGKNSCACCGESNIKFLTLDHIHNDGAKDRAVNGLSGGIAFFKRLIDKGLPSGYQILCWNCNCGKNRNCGVCPHKENIEKTFDSPPPFIKKKNGKKLGSYDKGFSCWKHNGMWELYKGNRPRKYMGRYRTKLEASREAIKITQELCPQNVDKVWTDLLNWATITVGD